MSITQTSYEVQRKESIISVQGFVTHPDGKRVPFGKPTDLAEEFARSIQDYLNAEDDGELEEEHNG